MAEHDHPSIADNRDSVAKLWATARGMEIAAAVLAARPGFDGDLRFSSAASNCAEAADELQRACPLPGDTADVHRYAVDFRIAPIDEATDALLAGLADGIARFDVDDPRLLPADLLAAGTAATWLAMAYHAVSGRLP